MIKTEMLSGGTLVRHYSDAGKMLLQVETGEMYSEAVDKYPSAYTYTETDDDPEISDGEALDIMFGGGA